MRDDAPRILVIRRDNIGDLVCTTPMIHMLRQRYPKAWIAALVTRYNAEVLAGNTDLDAVFSYQKAKHRGDGEGALAIYWQRLRQIVALRRKRLDLVILPASGAQPSALRLARWLKPARILTQPATAATGEASHEALRCAQVLAPLGITGTPPPLHVCASADAVAAVVRAMRDAGVPRDNPCIGIHISARKPNQRWPAERFVALMRALHARHGAGFILLWSPGDEANPLHPGDDAKAAQIVAGTRDLPCLAYPTHTLRELIAALSMTDAVICSDGGAMHLAAGLGKPIVCFFGSSEPRIWHPWGVPHAVLRPDSRMVGDVTVEDALDAYTRLATTVPEGTSA